MTLPYRFRESAFRYFEPYIARIEADFPNKVVFNPQQCKPRPLSPVTFACRLRDARKSFVDNHWQSEIDFAKFAQHYPYLIVSEQTDGLVAVGTRDSLKQVLFEQQVIKLAESMTDSIAATEVINVTQEQATLLAKLASFRLLSGKVRVTGITQEQASELEANFDCRIDQQNKEQNIWTII